MDKSKLNYSPAYVYEKQGCFRIIFHWRPDFKAPFRRYRNTFGLNRIKELKIRRQAAKVMAMSVTEMLRAGWNPETDEVPQKTPVAIALQQQDAVLSQLLKSALDNILSRTDKDRTISSYQSLYRLLVDYLKKNNLYHIKASAFTPLNALAYQKHLLQQGIAHKTINTKIEFATGLFKWMCRVQLMSHNPFDAVTPLKVKESNRNQIFTRKELSRIKLYSQENCPELWQYVLFIYYCFMRPASIMAIKKKDIDLENGWLFIDGKNHKNGNDAQKQLLPAHVRYLRPYIEGLDDEDYLFSSGMKPGKKRQYPTRAAEQWKKHIQQKLGIEKVAYGLKNTGAAHFLEKNNGRENLKWLQMQMSHSDLQTTSIYTNKMKVIRLQEGQEPEI